MTTSSENRGRDRSVRSRPFWRRRWVAVGAVSALLVGSAGGAVYAFAGDDSGRYRTATATLGSVAETLDLTGSIASASRRNVAFAVAGTVASVAVSVGDAVTAGQQLATLDPTDLQDAVDAADSSVADAKQKLADDLASQTATTEATTDATSTSATTTGSGAASPTGSSAAASGAAGTSSASSSTASISTEAVNRAVESVRAAQQALLDQAAAADAAVAESAGALTSSTDACAVILNATIPDGLGATAGSNESATGDEAGASDDPANTGAEADADSNATDPDAADSGDTDGSTSGGSDLAEQILKRVQGLLSTCQSALTATATAQTATQQAQAGLSTAVAALDAAVTALQEAVAGAAASTNGTADSPVPSEGSAPATGASSSSGGTSSVSGASSGGTTSSNSITPTTSSAAASTSGADAAAGGTAESSGAAQSSGVASAEDIVADQAQVTLAEAQAAIAEHQLAAASITAPIAGTVAQVAVKAGDDVSASSSTAIITVIGEDGYLVETTVSLADVPKVEVGQSVDIDLPSSGLELTGSVSAIGVLNVSTDSSTPTYAVTVAVEDGGQTLLNGAAAQLTVQVSAAEDVLAVPTSAVHRDGNTYSVDVLVDGVVTATPVEIGSSGAELTQIVDGIGEGDSVVLADLDQELDAGESDAPASLTDLGGDTSIQRVPGDFGGTLPDGFPAG